MNRGIRGHRMNKRDIIDTTRKMREQVTDPLAAFTVLMEIPARFDNAPLILMAAASEGFDIDRLVVATFHGRLVVERINVAGPAIHEQEDDVLGFRSKMRCLLRKRITCHLAFGT